MSFRSLEFGENTSEKNENNGRSKKKWFSVKF